MRKFALIVFLLGFTINLFSQKKEAKPVHSPKTAAIYSAVVPGLGQAYNKKYWKIPIIYGVGGYLFYQNRQFNKEYKLYKNAQEAFVNEEDYTKFFPEEDKTLLNPNNFRSARDNAHKDRDNFMFYCTLIYALNIVDAVIDAHLFEFNVSDDLSFKSKPVLLYGDQNLVLGNQITINF